MKKLALSIMSVAILAALPALADYYIAGDFNESWNPGHPDYMMQDMGGGVYAKTLTGESEGTHYFKVTDGTWDNAWPSSNAKGYAPGGELTLYFYEGEHFDGWTPQFNRVGREDRGLAWEIKGAFNNWGEAVVMSYDAGIYSAVVTFPEAGYKEFKFRAPEGGDNWANEVGYEGGSNNIGIDIANPGDPILMELDVLGGRYNLTLIPEPASLILLALAGLVLRRR
ncbi:MAG: PEP-CTERM sorting domain-containing protein [Planctomycetota bacterium]